MYLLNFLNLIICMANHIVKVNIIHTNVRNYYNYTGTITHVAS